ncbi:MAG: hypothetical protein ACOX6E_06720 [Syntrophomonadaceae bacterium]
MDRLNQLSAEEIAVAQRIESYFKSSSMTFQEKVFHAILITRYELEAKHFSDEHEYQRILEFARVLDRLKQKFI